MSDSRALCSTCKQSKPLTEFWIDKLRMRNRSRCKECDNRAHRERYAKKIGREPRPWGVGLTKKQNHCVECGTAISPAAQAWCRSCLAALRTTHDAPCREPGCPTEPGQVGKERLLLEALPTVPETSSL